MNLTCLHYTTCCIDFLFPMKLVDWTKGHATVHCMCFRHENVVRIAALVLYLGVPSNTLQKAALCCQCLRPSLNKQSMQCTSYNNKWSMQYPTPQGISRRDKCHLSYCTRSHDQLYLFIRVDQVTQNLLSFWWVGKRIIGTTTITWPSTNTVIIYPVQPR